MVVKKYLNHWRLKLKIFVSTFQHRSLLPFRNKKAPHIKYFDKYVALRVREYFL